MNEGCGRKIVPHLTLAPHRDPEYYACCTIINDDHRNHLWRFDEKSFDLLVADPPYGMHYKNVDWDDSFPGFELTALLGLARLASYIFCRWDNLWDSDARAPASEPGTPQSLAVRRGNKLHNGFRQHMKFEHDSFYPTVSAKPGYAVINNLPKPKSTLMWRKVGVGGGVGYLPNEHIRDFETALFYPGPEHKFKDKRQRSVLTFRAPGNNIHHTQKPVELIKEILGWYDFETVLDPYMGSGTTAVAAKLCGKHFLGFEANEGYFKDSIARIAEIGNKAKPIK